jgi:hypothetical protein
MDLRCQLSKSLGVLALATIALNVGAQTNATPYSPSGTAPVVTSNPAAPAGVASTAPQPMPQGQPTPPAMSSDGRMTSEQMREYVNARNACGVPSERTQPCNDAVHRRFTGVDPKCQTALGSALMDCLQNHGKGK